MNRRATHLVSAITLVGPGMSKRNATGNRVLSFCLTTKYADRLASKSPSAASFFIADVASQTTSVNQPSWGPNHVNNISVNGGHRVARAAQRTAGGVTDQTRIGIRYSTELESVAAKGACDLSTRDAIRVAAEGRQKSV